MAVTSSKAARHQHSQTRRWRRHAGGALAVAVLAIAIVADTLHSTAPAPVAHLALSVSSGPVGTVVRLNGAAGPGCVVGKTWSGFDFERYRGPTSGPVTEMTTLVSATGAWAASFVVPSYLGGSKAPKPGAPATPGRYEFAERSCKAHTLAEASFQVTSGASRATSAGYMGIAATPDGQGYWLVRADGGVAAFGDARFYGSLPEAKARPMAPIVGMAPTSDARGYWLAGADGHVYNFGDARAFGSAPRDKLAHAPVTGITATPDGRGYWLVGADGHVYNFGDARWEGEPDGDLAPYDAIVARPTGGYVVTAANDAAVSAFSGDALLSGGPGVALSATLVGTAVTPTGKGTWQVSLDGGIFTSGDAKFYGSLPGDDLRPEAPVTGIAGSPDGHGYWLVGADGTVYPFGDARFFGMAFQ